MSGVLDQARHLVADCLLAEQVDLVAELTLSLEAEQVRLEAELLRRALSLSPTSPEGEARLLERLRSLSRWLPS